MNLCPSCGSAVKQYTPPIRGESSQNEAWLCLWCPATICVRCYAEHTHGKAPARKSADAE